MQYLIKHNNKKKKIPRKFLFALFSSTHEE